MPHPRRPHLRRQITRHGKVVWYVRRVRDGRRVRVRLRAKHGTAAFDAEYQAALTAIAIGAVDQMPETPAVGTLAWLIERYRETGAWSLLSAATRRQRENIFSHVIAASGTVTARAITTATITAGVERRAKTPSQSRNFLDAMRGLFRWAAKAGLVKADPTLAVAAPRRPRTEGFVPWTEEHVAAYEARWPLGTRERVWLDVLLYTGLRRGDAVRIGRPHVRDGIGRIKTEKNGTAVALPILPVLAATLAAGPCGDLTFIAGERGQPLTKESFGNKFRAACRAARIPGSAHGVRKIAATRAANAGATVAELEAIFGWTGGAMASLYTRSADRERLALEAIHKIEGRPHPPVGGGPHPVKNSTKTSA